MSNSFFDCKFSFIIIFIIILFIVIFFIPIIYSQDISNTNIKYPSYLISINNNSFVWPTPGYTTITSNFGYRKSPIGGASSYHSGIDIAAPTNSNVFSISNGTVIFVGWNGAGGYSIIISYDSYIITYCHMSPDFNVHQNDTVLVGDFIGKVGPKNVYNVPNNPYKDSNGNPTNGATTGSHLHLSIKSNGKAIDPLKFFNQKNS